MTASVIFRVILGCGLCLAGIAILGVQIYAYLQTGEWTPISIVTVLAAVPDYHWWAINPTEWIGLHKVLDHIPVSAVLVVIGIVIIEAD